MLKRGIAQITRPGRTILRLYSSAADKSPVSDAPEAAVKETADKSESSRSKSDPAVNVLRKLSEPEKCVNYFTETVRLHKALVYLYEDKIRNEFSSLKSTLHNYTI